MSTSIVDDKQTKDKAAFRSAVSEMEKCLGAGLEQIYLAGKAWCRALEKNADAYEDIYNLCPSVSVSLLRRLEQIGRKVVRPELLTMKSGMANRLARLTYTEQARVLDNGLSLIVESKNGFDVLRGIKVEALDRAQLDQVFSKQGLRTQSEQRTYLEASKRRSVVEIAASKAVGVERDYVIKGGEVVVLRPCKFKQNDLLDLMKGLAK